MLRLCSELVRAGGELHVPVCDPPGRVRPPAEGHAAVVDPDVRMVVLRLRELPDPVHERERFGEVAERERPLERTVDLTPALRPVHGRSMPFGDGREYDRAMVASPEPDETKGFAPALAEPGLARRSTPELLVEWIFRPLAGIVVAALLPLRVSPVAVVLANALAGLAAAIAIVAGQLVAAALLLQLKTVLDNADGQLARASGRTTALGRYLDTELDLVVNLAVFAALAHESSSLLPALASFLMLTVVLSADFNEDVLHRRARGESFVTEPSTTGEGVLARALARIYGLVFAPQDRALQSVSRKRLERLLLGVSDSKQRERVTLAYYDGVTSAILANLGLSTQLAMLGVCLVLEAPVVYLWLVLGFAVLLPLLQVRRELVARRVVRGLVVEG